MNGYDEDTDTDAGENVCPFCSSADDCEHLLLLLDLTFRTAEGGLLAEAFRDRWEIISDREDGDFDEREAFDEQLDEVDSLADGSLGYVIEGGPGGTSEYAAYFCSSKERVTAAIKDFVFASSRYDTVEGDQCPFCHKVNAPAAGDTCEHHVGWKWDGAFELDTDLDDLQRAWQEASDNIQSRLGQNDFNRRLTAVVEGVDLRQRLVEKASGDAEFEDLLEALGVQVGVGWQTNGMLGGSGHNLYADDRKRLTEAASFYGLICQEAD